MLGPTVNFSLKDHCAFLRRLNMKWVALLLFVLKREHKKIITLLVFVCFTGCSLFGAFLLASVIIELPNFDAHPTQTSFLVVDICSFMDGLAFFFF